MNPQKFPSRWDSKLRGEYCQLFKKGQTVMYTGPEVSEGISSSVLANMPIPQHCAIYYFEIEIMRGTNEGIIGVGLAPKDYDLKKLPGWDHYSIALHGDDGNVFFCDPAGDQYLSDGYTTGDKIGVCYNLLKRQLFFVKNGEELSTIQGVEFKKQLPYPILGMRSPTNRVATNFGDKAFLFDIDAYFLKEKKEYFDRINTAQIKKNLMFDLILSHLKFKGNYKTYLMLLKEKNQFYPELKNEDQKLKTIEQRHNIEKKTQVIKKNDEEKEKVKEREKEMGKAKEMEMEMEMEKGKEMEKEKEKEIEIEKDIEKKIEMEMEKVKNQNNIQNKKQRITNFPNCNKSINQIINEIKIRKKIEKIILNGEIIQAKNTIEEYYPNLLLKNPKIKFQLQKQIFLEMLKNGDDINLLLSKGTELYQYSEKNNKKVDFELRKILALIFKHSLLSNKKVTSIPILNKERKNDLCFQISKCILQIQNEPLNSPLSRMINHLSILKQFAIKSKKVRFISLININEIIHKEGNLY
ncbi:ran-binding protein 9/10 [Anaeramoeba flamelloides]|uniref:Ran-binding protein 9/10 n=1 Tax=Anaeramoeba flamelloides TaxID=1746091 RepID=A0AAV7YA91_9EUKA|nr:ran-binding protein 9/10 [Anaeramoeba flamelloides]